MLEGFSRPSGKVLVAVNLALLAGVFALDWNVFDIVFLYWAENLVIGVINVMKMLTAHHDPFAGMTDSDGQPLVRDRSARLARTVANVGTKLFIVPFFIIHYGGFCAGHGFFIFVLFREVGEFTGDLKDAVPELLTAGLLLSLAGLAASHLYSFFTNYLGSGEYRRTTPMELMARPYGRIVALHITIIVGGFLVVALGDPKPMLVVLVILKTGVDLAMHGRERQKYQDDEAVATTA